MKMLLKMIPIKLVISLAWDIISPILLKKIQESESKIDDLVYKELSDLIKELSK